jgi:antitoxin VapB
MIWRLVARRRSDVSARSMEMWMERAKIFWSGRSQAVRLPKGFRLSGDEVRIRRHGNSVILEPIPTGWAWLDAMVGKLDNDVAEAALEDVAEQERPALNKLFP